MSESGVQRGQLCNVSSNGEMDHQVNGEVATVYEHSYREHQNRALSKQRQTRFSGAVLGVLQISLVAAPRPLSSRKIETAAASSCASSCASLCFGDRRRLSASKTFCVTVTTVQYSNNKLITCHNRYRIVSLTRPTTPNLPSVPTDHTLGTSTIQHKATWVPSSSPISTPAGMSTKPSCPKKNVWS